uniref:Uncharacterized protein n=1 Tax=Arundo donax TaxID=35708 RepID=A0A0A9HQ43_ARUDO
MLLVDTIKHATYFHNRVQFPSSICSNGFSETMKFTF